MSREQWLKIGKRVWTIALYVFAAIGFVLVVGYLALQLGLTKVTGVIDLQRQSFLNSASSTAATAPEYPNGTPWQDTQEWTVLSEAITKDAPAIDQAASASGVPARLIVANLVV